MARDNRIYGFDDNSMAEDIAAGALTPVAGASGTNISDYWGATKDDDQRAVGNVEAKAKDDVTIIRKAQAGGGDKEAMDASTKGGQRHRPGPSDVTPANPPPPRRFRGMKNQ